MPGKLRRLFANSAPLACTLILACAAVSGQQQSSGAVKDEVAAVRATVEQLRAEVAQLRKDVARLEFERHRETIRQIKAELNELRAENAGLAELDRVRQQDLRDVEELLSQREFEPAQRLDIETARNDLAAARWRKIEQQSEAARNRESEMLRRLETEEQIVRRLDEAWKLTGGKTQ